MDGRWTLLVNRNGEAWTVDPDVSVYPQHGESLTPVVPCDDAAIERAAAEMATWAGPVPHGADGFRPFAERVLRAAGETP